MYYLFENEKVIFTAKLLINYQSLGAVLKKVMLENKKEINS